MAQTERSNQCSTCLTIRKALKGPIAWMALPTLVFLVIAYRKANEPYIDSNFERVLKVLLPPVCEGAGRGCATSAGAGCAVLKCLKESGNIDAAEEYRLVNCDDILLHDCGQPCGLICSFKRLWKWFFPERLAQV